MDDKLKHIDSYFKEALEDFTPVETKTRGWRIVWFKLILLSVGIKTFAAFIILLTGVSSIMYFQFGDRLSATDMHSNENTQKQQQELVSNNSLQAQQINSTQQTESIDFKNTIVSDQANQQYKMEIIDHNSAKDIAENHKPIITTEGPETRENKPSDAGAMETAGIIKRNEFPNYKMEISSIPLKTPAYFKSGANNDSIPFKRDSLAAKGLKVVTASLLFTAQPGLVFNNIYSLADDAHSTNLYVDPEKYIATLGFGADLKVQLKNWYLRTGINYSTYGENSTYQETRYIPDHENSTVQYDTNWLWVIDPPNIGYYWLHSIDTLLVPTIIEKVNQYETKNRYHYIEIPISFGYQRFIKQYSIAVNAGISVGFILNHNGFTPGNAENAPGSMSYSLRQPQLNTMLQFNFGIPLSEKLQFFLEPTFKTSLNSIYDDPRYPLHQTYFSFGLHLGLQIDL